MAYGRAGFAQGLAQGLGNISAMLREKRLTAEDERRRQEDLARREQERKENVQMQMLGPALAGEGGLGEVPRTPAGTVRPAMLPEPEGPRRTLGDIQTLRGAPPLPPRREQVSLPEPSPTALEPRGAPMTLMRGLTDTYEPIVGPGGAQAYRKRPEVLEREAQGRKEALATEEAERMGAALMETPRFRGRPGETPEQGMVRAREARGVAEGVQAGIPGGLLTEPQEPRETGRLTEQQAWKRVLQYHPEYMKTDEDGNVTGYTVPITQIQRMADAYRAGRTPPEDVEFERRPKPAGMPSPYEAAQAKIQAGGDVQAARQAAGAAGAAAQSAGRTGAQESFLLQSMQGRERQTKETPVEQHQAATEATQLQVARQRRQEIKQEHPDWTEAQVKEQMQKEGLVR
mgnify:CR=1 FL=1